MSGNSGTKLLFVINAGAGTNKISWQDVINNYFTGKAFELKFFLLGEKPEIENLKNSISQFRPDKVIAVGGDGTVTLVAKIIAGSDAALGILPAGSANGMAKELNISAVPEEALGTVENGIIKDCDAIKINDQHICLHLSDIGLNAQLIKYFDQGKLRGKWGYARMIIKTLWRSQKMQVTIHSNENEVNASAFMIVLANASKYGTGAVINPEGKIDDGLFEVVIIHKRSMTELLKMLFRPGGFNPKKTEIFHASSVHVKTRRKAHFQIDGEYMGKIAAVEAVILPDYLKVITPEKEL